MCSALSGRHSSSSSEKLLVSYMDDAIDDLVIKNDISIGGASSLREAVGLVSDSNTPATLQNLFGETDAAKKYFLRVFDLTGKNVMVLSGHINYLKAAFAQTCKALDKSVYFLELRSEDNATAGNVKILMGDN